MEKIFSSMPSRLIVLIFAGISIFSASSCLVAENEFEALPPGVWRGSLQLDPTAFVAPENAVESIVSQDD